MSVCQFHLRGNCRYGDRCRLSHVNSFEPRPRHPIDSSFRPRQHRPQVRPEYNYVAPSATNNNHHVGHPTTTRKEPLKNIEVFEWAAKTFSNKDKALDILIQLQKEARVWQKSSSFWRFTSRSLFPGGQPLPDWHDQSFEEIKWACQSLTSQNQEHVYKKAYNDYITKTERHLIGLAKARLETLESLKDYINQYILSDHKPSATLSSDIEMKDLNDNTTSIAQPSADPTNYTPEDQLLEDERAAFESDTFEFGSIPVHAPPRQRC